MPFIFVLHSILPLETTFVNRRNTNEFVPKSASEHMGHDVLRFSDLLHKRKASLAGHIIRTDDNDPLRQVTYTPNTACAYPVGKKEWEVRGSSGDISLTNTYGKTFWRREQILKTQKDKTKESTKWLSHGIFKAVHTWAPRTLVRPRPEKKN